MILVIGPEAEEDLAEIYEYIAVDNVRAADRMLDRLWAVMQKLADGDLNGPPVRLADGRRMHGFSVRDYLKTGTGPASSAAQEVRDGEVEAGAEAAAADLAGAG